MSKRAMEAAIISMAQQARPNCKRPEGIFPAPVVKLLDGGEHHALPAQFVLKFLVHGSHAGVYFQAKTPLAQAQASPSASSRMKINIATTRCRAKGP